MASRGDKLLEVVTADWVNEVNRFMGRRSKLTGSGLAQVSDGPAGKQISVAPPRAAISTIQGILVGGSAPAVTDGTVIIDPYAWAAYSIQGAYFILSAGTTTLTVNANGVAVSWLTSLSISTTPMIIPPPSPMPDQTNSLPAGALLSITLSGSSSDAAGLSFSLNTPF